MPTDQLENDLRDARARVEELEHELAKLREGVADAVLLLSGESGDDVDALRDATGQIDRLLAGDDVDAGLDLQGFARAIEERMLLPHARAVLRGAVFTTDASGGWACHVLGPDDSLIGYTAPTEVDALRKAIKQALRH